MDRDDLSNNPRDVLTGDTAAIRRTTMHGFAREQDALNGALIDAVSRTARAVWWLWVVVAAQTLAIILLAVAS